VSSTVNLNVNGLDNMVTTIQGGEKPLATSQVIELKPVTTVQTSNVGGTDKPIGLNEVIEVKPLELKPVTLNENMNIGGTDKAIGFNEVIDLKPVAVDTCQTYKLAPLPDTEVCQPYRHRVAYTIFGMEYLGVTYDGESTQVIESPKRPKVVERLARSTPRRPTIPAVHDADSGIRVRVLDDDE
jgi:hypothetical protein